MDELFSVEDIKKAVGGKIVAGEENRKFSNISIDSRRINQGCLFIAIKGENKNGHLFIKEALAKGASGILLSERENESIGFAGSTEEQPTIIKVHNTLLALQQIACHRRKKFGVQVIGITGSNGKSTTKEITASILSTKFRVLKNKGNLNNHYGLPLSLLELQPNHDVAVLEMGMNHLGEIKRLCEIALPQYGAVTNIGEAHLESLGSMDKVLEAKKELVDFLGPDDTVILNEDDPTFSVLKDGAKGRVFSFGLKKEADYQARDIVAKDTWTEFTLTVEGKERNRCRIKAPGIHNVYNALCAAALANRYGVDEDGIAEGLESYEPLPMRMQVLKWKDFVVINDAYNANIASMGAAINILADRAVEGKRIFVAGDMLELGEHSKSAHDQVGEMVAQKNFDYFLTFGDMAESCGKAALENGLDPARVRNFKDPIEAASFLKGMLGKGDCLLVKGSRGMRMERIVEKIIGD